MAMREVLEQLTCTRNRRVALVTAGEGDDALVLLDTVGLRRIVLNLLLNALDAAPIGSTVHIGWRALPAAEARTRFPRYTGPVVCLGVRDEGPGIPPELLPRVVEPFFTTKSTGTGLGLAVVAQIVAAHGGVLELSSRPGEGTHVQVYFPGLVQAAPCWEAKACDEATRDACRVWREGTGFGCWALKLEGVRAELGYCPERCRECAMYAGHALAPYPAPVVRVREDA
jgi:signal transduction histidine kinase